jgi:hypothetical protein
LRSKSHRGLISSSRRTSTKVRGLPPTSPRRLWSPSAIRARAQSRTLGTRAKACGIAPRAFRPDGDARVVRRQRRAPAGSERDAAQRTALAVVFAGV